MKLLFTLFCSFCFAFSAASQTTAQKTVEPDKNKPLQQVEVSCGKCKLGLPGKSCDMAVRINDKVYYTDGASIDDFGDAHADDGMCNAIRKAEVQGEVVNNRFKVSYIKVLPLAKENKQ